MMLKTRNIFVLGILLVLFSCNQKQVKNYSPATGKTDGSRVGETPFWCFRPF